MANKPKSKVNQKGRNSDASGRDNAVLIYRRSNFQSPRISLLGTNSRALMFELLSLHNGKNNGSLFLSLNDATDRLGFSDWRPAAAAFEELTAAGLITCTYKGYFSITAGEASRATAWRLNWVDANGKLIADDQLPGIDWTRLGPKARKRMERRQIALKRYHRDRQEGKFSVVETTALAARRAVEITISPNDSTVETTALEGESRENPPLDLMVKSTAHIYHHSPSDDDRPVETIRATVRDWWRLSDKSDRLKLAKKNGLQIGELLSFVDGTGDLPFPKVVAIRASVNAWSEAA